MLPSLMMAALLSAADAGTLPHTLFIFSGAPTKEAADAEMATWAQLKAPFERVMAPLSAGYPKVVESAKIEGLKPGFFIVVLAACATTPAGTKPHSSPELLELYKAIDPKIYARPAVWPEALACPAARQAWSAPAVAETKVTGGTLRGALLSTGARLFNGRIGPTVHALFLRDPKGVVLHQSVTEDSCEASTLEKSGATLVGTQTCDLARCASGGTADHRYTWSVQDGKIVGRDKESNADKCAD